SDDSGPFSWIAGLYYLHDQGEQLVTSLWNTALIGLPETSSFAEVETNAYAAFGEGTYRFSDLWALTAGLRYSYEKKHHIFDNGAVMQDDEKSFNAWTPRFVLEFTPAD